MVLWRRKEQRHSSSMKRELREQSVAFRAKTQIHRYGMTILYAPEKTTVVDIVFVHGIRGDPEKTWAAENGKSFWLDSLLPKELPDARIITFGYDASAIGLRSSVSSNNISRHAKNLLSDLARCRSKDDEYHRPIIFLAHSMGGLVCKDALLAARSSAEPHLQRILDASWGIMFLGTPHSGTGLAIWAERVAMWAGLVKQTNTDIVGVLRRDSEILGRIQDDFHSMLRSRIDEGHRRIYITCYYEELPLAGIGEVVPHWSATIPGYPSIGIHADHRQMARFSSINDQGFIRIVGELRRWIEDIKCSMPPGPEPMRTAITSDADTEIIKASNIDMAGIVIWGDVKQSNIISGNQTIVGSLSFRD